MKVLILFEYSGEMRKAFASVGHDVTSIDLREGENLQYGKHFVCDAYDYADKNAHNFDLLIAHPVCQYLSNAGVSWLYKQEGRWELMRQAALQFKKLQQLNVKYIAIENPVMHGHARKLIDSWDFCSVQPWQFGHMEKKRTCFWLKNLPALKSETNLLNETNKLPKKIQQRIHYMAPSADREKERSRTFPGIAKAAAKQWSDYIAKDTTETNQSTRGN